MTLPRALAPTYGTLTVGRSYREGRRYLTEVTCTCGRTKSVFTSGLREGRVKSCGVSPCRPRLRARGVPYDAARPEWLRNVWRHMTEEHLSVRAIAAMYRVAPSTLYHAIRRMRDVGGPEELIAREAQDAR